MNLEQIKAIANDIIQDKEWVNDSHSALEHKGVKDGLHRLINHLEEVKEETEFITVSKERIEFFKENINSDMEQAKLRNKSLNCSWSSQQQRAQEWNKGLIHGYQDALQILDRLLKG